VFGLEALAAQGGVAHSHIAPGASNSLAGKPGTSRSEMGPVALPGRFTPFQSVAPARPRTVAAAAAAAWLARQALPTANMDMRKESLSMSGTGQVAAAAAC
jgi:hypothetical protein